MKFSIKKISLLLIFIFFASCQNEQEIKVEKLTNQYVKFIDSVTNISQDKVLIDWKNIETIYDTKTNQLNEEIDNLDEKSLFDEKINIANKKYDDFKKSIDNLKSKFDSENQELKRRKELFGGDYIGNDLEFEWVTKDNILNVYNHFVSTVDKNKDTYTREDWDEIKLQYEALDTRKNTVEKEGLTSDDNMKIAGLKMKFGPMYRLYRIASKSEENTNSKK